MADYMPGHPARRQNGLASPVLAGSAAAGAILGAAAADATDREFLSRAVLPSFAVGFAPVRAGAGPLRHLQAAAALAVGTLTGIFAILYGHYGLGSGITSARLNIVLGEFVQAAGWKGLLSWMMAAAAACAQGLRHHGAACVAGPAPWRAVSGYGEPPARGIASGLPERPDSRG
jgi:hypothetical protein